MMNFEMDSDLDLVVSIKVAGVGGGGGNAVNRMIESNIQGVEFVTVNCDKQVLLTSSAPTKIAIGEKVTKGHGAGSNPEVGKQAAEENLDDLKAILSGADMVFITTGMGGGTGTGAAPVVAKVAKEMGILTVGIVTKPFAFEGRKRMVQAENGIVNLREYVDSLVVIPNERLKLISENRITLSNAFEYADDILRHGVQSISDLINIPGIVNLDFADVSSVMRDAGYAHMGVGIGSGRDKAEVASKMAVSSPLLESSISGATGIIINVTASPDISLDEVETASAMISNEAHPEATIIWGATFDNSLEDTIKVTVIATGIRSDDEGKRPTPMMGGINRPAAAPAAPAAPSYTNTVRRPEPVKTAPIASDNKDNLISDSDFDDIMNILRKNRG